MSTNRLYALALIAVPVLTAAEDWCTYVARGGGAAPDSDVGRPAMLAPIREHTGLWQTGAFLALAFVLLLLPAVLGLLSLTRERAPRLTAVAAVLTLGGLAAAAMEVVTWNVVVGAMASVPETPSLPVFADALESYPPMVLGFVLLSVFDLGLLLVAGALWRSRAVPRWAAVAAAALPLDDLLPLPDGWVYTAVCAVWLAGLVTAARALLVRDRAGATRNDLVLT